MKRKAVRSHPCPPRLLGPDGGARRHQPNDPVDIGKRFYEQGSETIAATLAGPGIERPSSAFACIGCHGADGRGGREGGVEVPAITWRHLGARSARRPAYDLSSFQQALEDGVDPDGRALHPTMPRYHVAEETVRALAGYLQVIGRQPVAGVSARSIKIATVIPGGGRLQEAAAVAADVMRGGAGRTPTARAGPTAGRSRSTCSRMGVPCQEDLFALVGRMAPAAETGAPALDLFPLHQDPGGETGGVTFKLLPSLDDQARLMARKMAAEHDRALLIASTDPWYREAADAAEREAASIEGFELNRVDFEPEFETGDVSRLFREAAEHPLLYLADSSPLTHLDVADQFLDLWTSLDLVASTLAKLIEKPGLSLTLLDPHPPAETGHDRHRLFETIMGRHGRDNPHHAIATLAAAAAFATIDCLRATGRRLTRTTFDAACSTIPAIETGLISPFLPGRSWAVDAVQWLEINGGSK